MTTPHHVVLGGGTIGTTIAEQLVAAGERVRLVTRSGRNPGVAGAETAAADLTDAAAVRAVAAGARVAYFACQPAYTDWPKGFPPLAEGVLGGLAGSGTRLAVVDNTYMYGPTGGRPMTEDLPYAATTRKGVARARLAERFMAAHAAGDVPVVIARASDYFGPRGATSSVGDRFFPPLLAGKSVQVFGDVDAPHSNTYVPDFARTLDRAGAAGRGRRRDLARAHRSCRVTAALRRDGGRRGRRTRPEPQPALQADAAVGRDLRAAGPRDDRDGVRVRGAVPARLLEDRAGIRPSPDAARGRPRRDGRLVARPGCRRRGRMSGHGGRVAAP